MVIVVKISLECSRGGGDDLEVKSVKFSLSIILLSLFSERRGGEGEGAPSVQGGLRGAQGDRKGRFWRGRCGTDERNRRGSFYVWRIHDGTFRFVSGFGRLVCLGIWLGCVKM